MAEPAVFKIEFEYINPTNIECEVPGDQKLREFDEANADDEASNDALQDSNNENDEDSNKFVFEPVITVTKQEASYTKGDLKLQKVSVNENISDEEPGINGAVYYTINSNPNIQSDVIHGHPVRVQDDDDDKPKTRIPMMKFKHAAEKVKKDRRASLDKKDEIPSSRLTQKRSSIPRLQRRASKPDTKTETAQPDDEFDKLYHEIVDDEPKETLIESIEIKVEDPLKLENKFEEIIHDYEENKLQPLHVDKKHTKIPLIKRKSEQEIKVLKPVEKASIVTLKKTYKEEVKPEKIETKIPKLNDVAHKTARTKFNIVKSEDNPKTNVKLPTKIREPEIKKQVATPEKSKGTDFNPKLESATLIKRVLESKNKENNNDVLVKPKAQRTYSEDKPNVADIKKDLDVKSNRPLEEPRESLSNAKTDPVKVITSKEFEQKIKENDHDSLTMPKDSKAIRRTYSEDNSKIVGISSVKDIKIKKPGILAETKHKNKPAERLNENDNETQIKEKMDVDTDLIIKDENTLVTNQNEIVVDEPNDLTLSEIELKPEQMITVEYAPDNVYEENEILESQAETNEKNNKIPVIEESDDNEYTPGKVSRLLKRIRSKEFGTHDVEKEVQKKEIVEIQKKKSVLSKIAMFEHHEPLKASKSRVPHVQKPPTKSLLKDEPLVTERKPIIVDELLKSTEKHKPYNVKTEKLIITEPEQSNSEENEQKDYVVEIVDESVKYHEVQFIEDLESKIDIEDQNELLIVTEDAPNTPISIATSEFEPTPIRNEVQIIEPINTDYLKPPIQNVDEKVPINEVSIESLEYKPIEFEFKDEIIADDDAEVFSDEKEKNRKPKRFQSRQESRLGKQKSVAEIDLGDVVKGRVHEMIVRMKSMENLDVQKKEIDRKERPRKRSVSKIIALFEQKTSPTQPATIFRPETHTKVTIDRPALSEEEYEKRNKELLNGKINYGRIENMTYLVLANGVEMPVIALGTALIDKHLVHNVVGAAIDMGYRAIDTAYIYGNEKEVGEAIKAKIDDGTVEREDLFIISKLWSTYHRSDLVPRACKNSLDAMGLDYFDLYLIHNPMSFKEGNDPIPKIANVIQYSDFDYLDAWYGMETLVSKGLAKSIGVSNFNSVQVQRILDRSKVKPVVNQVECHPYLTQQRLDEFCSTRDIKLSCFGVLGSVGTPAEMKSNQTPVYDDPLVKVMAAGLNISVAQLLIRYQIDSGHSVVVKASTAAHLWDNLQALQISLTQSQLDALSALNRNKRTFTFVGMGDTHRNYPFKIPF